MAPSQFPHPSDLDRRSLRMVAVSPYSAVRLEDIYKNFSQKAGTNHFTYLKNFAQELPAMGLKPAMILTDVFRALTYSGRDLASLIETYGKLLAVGGHAYFNIPIKNLSLVDFSGRPVAVINYLARLEGLKLVKHHFFLMSSGVQMIVELVRTSEPINIPQLVLIDLKTFPSEVMPFRKYRLSLKNFPVESEWSAADLEERIHTQPELLSSLMDWQSLDVKLSNEARFEILVQKNEQKNITELNPSFSQTLKEWLGDTDPSLRAESMQFLVKNTHFWIPSMLPKLQLLVRDQKLSSDLRIKAYAMIMQSSVNQPLSDQETSTLLIQYFSEPWVNDLSLVSSILKRLERSGDTRFERLNHWQIYFALTRFKTEVTTVVRLALYSDFSKVAPAVRREVQKTLVKKLKEVLQRWESSDLLVNQNASESDRSFLKQSISEIEEKFSGFK